MYAFTPALVSLSPSGTLNCDKSNSMQLSSCIVQRKVQSSRHGPTRGGGTRDGSGKTQARCRLHSWRARRGGKTRNRLPAYGVARMPRKPRGSDLVYVCLVLRVHTPAHKLQPEPNTPTTTRPATCCVRTWPWEGNSALAPSSPYQAMEAAIADATHASIESSPDPHPNPFSRHTDTTGNWYCWF